MISLKEYLENPCGRLSIPYWKSKSLGAPESIKIIHGDDYGCMIPEGWRAERYFRLYHRLENVQRPMVKGFGVRQAEKGDIGLIADIINKSYSDLSVSIAQLEGYMQTEAYDQSLWILAIDCKSQRAAACGIADFDRQAGEGILEWIQVLPEYRGMGIGSLVVGELLYRMDGRARFATVSGKVDSPSNPQALYRKCGFEGNDIWHILFAR